MQRFKEIFFIFFFLFLTTSLYAEPIAVVVNKQNPAIELSSPELRRIYESKMFNWQDGAKIIPINRESTSQIRITFSKIVHGKDPEEMKVYWYGERYKAAQQPIVQGSSALIKKVVSTNAGAIGYVYLSEVDDTVKVLKIDGLAPGEGGYTLE